MGFDALFSNTSGSRNTADGSQALQNNTIGGANIAVGSEALQLNVSAGDNVAVGRFAAQNNDSSGAGLASGNTAVGGSALRANVDGSSNTAVGQGAIESGNGGKNNTAVGELAGSNITGNSNTCLGQGTGFSLTGGEGNIYIGAQVQPVGTNEAEFIRIGNDAAFSFPYDTFIAGIYNRAFGPADMAVRIGSDGKLGTVVSSRRFKHDIKLMDNASEAILALKPVTFQYNSDTTNTPRVGLIAEEVAEVSPDLVIRDKEGKPLSVRYEDVNVMLLSEFIKEHKKVEEQQANIAELKSTVAQQRKGMEVLTAQLKEQAAQIQKVSDRVELKQPAPQMVDDRR